MDYFDAMFLRTGSLLELTDEGKELARDKNLTSLLHEKSSFEVTEVQRKGGLNYLILPEYLTVVQVEGIYLEAFYFDLVK